MLEEIIKMQLCKITDSPDIDGEAIEKFNSLYNKLKSISEDLAEEFDIVDGEIRAAYSEMYFQIGFKKGLALSNEIKEVC